MSGFSTVKPAFPTFFILCSLEGSYCIQRTPEGYAPLLQEKSIYLHDLFGILHGRFLILPHLVINSYQYRIMGIYCLLWVMVQYYFIPWLKLSLIRAPIIVSFLFVLALIYFLTLQDSPGSSCVFPDPVLEAAISPRNSGFFLREWY